MSYSDWILERSFGGLGTAAAPGVAASVNGWVDGPSAPGALEACNRLVLSATRKDSSDSASTIVLLVGGAGNGKSKLAADTIQRLETAKLIGQAGGVQRLYEYELECGKRLNVLNDATIQPEGKSTTPLVNDLVRSMEQGDHMLACVNRGVLINEMKGLSSTSYTGYEAAAGAVIAWLLGQKFEKSCDLHLEMQEMAQTDHYSFGVIKSEQEPIAEVHVVFMDHASLLEEWPSVRESDGNFQGPVCLEPIVVRPLDAESGTETKPAFGACVSGTSGNFIDTHGGDDLDPILANAKVLSSSSVVRGWCAVARGAEVVSGTHFTYREMWALYVHSIVGPAVPETLAKLSSHVERLIGKARSTDKDVRLSALLGLGRLRAHMLLFDAGKPSNSADDLVPVDDFDWPLTSNEALAAMTLADPLRDFGPSDGEGYREIAELVSEIEEGRKPGEMLAAKDPRFAAIWTPLDTEIERAVLQETKPGRDKATMKRRNWLLGWYGRYFYRMVGLARGWPAHFSLISEWQESWLDANKRGSLSSTLENALFEIVMPGDGQRGETYFSILGPRVEPANGAAAGSYIELSRRDFDLRASTAGDRIELTFEKTMRGREPKPVVEAVLDFHLLREAVARKGGHGFTDSLSLIEPRIERMRAGLVAGQLADRDNSRRYQFIRGRHVVSSR